MVKETLLLRLTQDTAEVKTGRRVISAVAVHLEDLSGLGEVVLHHGEELAHLVACHRVALAVVAVTLERSHPACTRRG